MKNEVVFQKTAILNSPITSRYGVPKLFSKWLALPEALGGVLIEDRSSVALGELDTLWRFETEEDAAIAVALLSEDIFAEVAINEEKSYILYWPDGRTNIIHGVTVATASEAAGLRHKDMKMMSHWKEEKSPSMKWDAKERKWLNIFPETVTIYRECILSSFGTLTKPLSLQDVLSAVNAECRGSSPLILSDVSKVSWAEDVSEPGDISTLGLYRLNLNNNVTIKVWVVKTERNTP